MTPIFADDDDWDAVLNSHPIFSKSNTAPEGTSSLVLSATTLPKFTTLDPKEDGPTPSGRRQVMILKDSDLIAAVGKELRITSLSEAKTNRESNKTFKTLHTPNVQFEIHQIVLNSSGKLLAVAGAFQVAVVVVPRSGTSRLVPDLIDCKSVNIGQIYHASPTSAPIAKLEWHPWGDSGSTLLVMTVDGKLREYDISTDTEEPQQVLSFVPEKKGTYLAEDHTEREVASFTLGKGRADWGPLTVYVVMKSGDIYAICPYMPMNSSIPSAYIHSLECFIAAKQEFLSQHPLPGTESLCAVYDYQHKYVNALLKQLPPGTVFPATSQSVLMHPPTTIKARPSRQGPFLLQPAPRILEGSDACDATDIAYLAFGADEETDRVEAGSETEHLGIVMVAYQDGKVDLCLDVEKVEARWEVKNLRNIDLPMLAVYESIDLGLIKMLNVITTQKFEPPVLDLLQANHSTLLVDPIYDDTVYVYHAFGVHLLNLGPVLQSLALALRREDDGSALENALRDSAGTKVRPLLTTFSVERKCSNPVVAIAIPNDAYLTYCIFILTSALRITAFPLTLRSDSTSIIRTLTEDVQAASQKSLWLKPAEGPPAYVSLLGNEPFLPIPCLQFNDGLPHNARLSLPPLPPGSDKRDFMLTPDTFRYLGNIVGQFGAQINEVQVGLNEADKRASLQQQEVKRMAAKCNEMETLVQQLKGPRRTDAETRIKKVQETQKIILARLDRMLQSLIERSSPELSEHETKWFEELKRMKIEIMGAYKYDDSSLLRRAKILESEYARIAPQMRALLEKEKQRKDKEVQNQLGRSQFSELLKRSSLEQARIQYVEQDLVRLANKLEISIGQPPGLTK